MSLRLVIRLRDDGSVVVPRDQLAGLFDWFRRHKKYVKIEAGNCPAPPQEPPVRTGLEDLVTVLEFPDQPG